MRIPFNRPSVRPTALQAVARVIEGDSFSGNGKIGKSVENKLGELFPNSRVLLTNSCSSALDMAVSALGIVPGDEVIVPSFTFPTSVSGVVRSGGSVVFADISPDSLSLSTKEVLDSISPRTRAVFITHYAGIPAPLLELRDKLESMGVEIVEDAAHAIGASHHGHPLGSFGSLGTLSFHETKNITCGEGGALLVNDESFSERAQIIREKGTNRAQFTSGRVAKYEWVGIGNNYLLSEINAAVLSDQLSILPQILERRRTLWERYYEGFEDWLERSGFTLPNRLAGEASHIFYILAPSPESRARMLRFLAENGVQAVSHYEPLHLSPAGKLYSKSQKPLTVTEDIAARLLRLPLYVSLKDSEVDYVIEKVYAFISAES